MIEKNPHNVFMALINGRKERCYSKLIWSLREGGRERVREGGSEGGREGGSEGGKGREGGREGGEVREGGGSEGGKTPIQQTKLSILRPFITKFSGNF